MIEEARELPWFLLNNATKPGLGIPLGEDLFSIQTLEHTIYIVPPDILFTAVYYVFLGLPFG